MLIYLGVLAFLIFLMYFIERERKGFSSFSWKQKYQRIVVLALLGLVPLVMVQLFLPSEPKDKADYYLRVGKATSQAQLKQRAYYLKCQEDPSYANFLHYFFEYEHYGSSACRELDQFVKQQKLSEDKTKVLLALIKTICKVDILGGNDLQLSSTDQSGYHFALALDHYYKGEHEAAEQHFWEEVNYPDLKLYAYQYLERILENQPKELEKLYLNWDATKYLPTHPKQEFYFQNQHTALYVHSVYYDYYKNAEWITVLIATLVCLIWIVYVWSIDVFEREKWYNVAIVFLLSWGMTNLCFFFYDFFHLNLNLTLGGSALDDFIYCSVVIGGSEELIKLLPWVLFILINRKAADEPYDYIFYASVSALGFAGAENVMYYENYDMSVIVRRAIMTSVGHMFFASIVAYSVVLMKYRFQNKTWRWSLPIIGFVMACLAHGFYDFWLISPKVSFLQILTILFFILSLHIWSVFKNNAINQSPYYTSQGLLAQHNITFVLLAGFIAVLMLEYMITSYQIGLHNSESILRSSSLFMAFFGTYLLTTFESMKLRKGRWNKIKWPLQDRIKSLLNLPHSSDQTGLQLRLFAPKDNAFIGHQLPVTGEIIDKVRVDNAGGWYVFRLNQTISVPNYDSQHIIIRQKEKDDELDEDKIEIIFMLIEDMDMLSDPNLKSSDLRYVGRTYSRPI